MNDLTLSILITVKNAASAVLNTINDEFSQTEGQLDKIAQGLAVVTTALVAGLALGVSSAYNFEKSMTNVAAVLGQTRQEQQALSSEILDFGVNTLAGPQAVASAYYDIVGGVADASTHMAILTAANATAEAGAASLGSTTNALISVMNSYKFSADQATFASDVLTRTVQVGVGTMEDFATALPQVTGLANSLDISLDTVGSSLAYLTTQGYSASIAATQLRAMMVSMINPNTVMNGLLKNLGYESGAAAIQQLGLSGAFRAVQQQASATGQNFAQAIGSVEALNGAIALSSTQASDALESFNANLKGATDAARDIQLQSPAAQMDLFKSSIEGLRIEIGNALLPVLNGIIEKVRPVITIFMDWIQKNPEVVQTIAALVGAIGLFIGYMTTVVPVIGAVRNAITLLQTSLGPVGIIVGLIALAFMTNFGGIRDMFMTDIMPLLNAFGELMGALFDFLGPLLKGIFSLFSTTFGAILELLKPFIEILTQIVEFITDIIKLITGDLNGAIRGMPVSPAVQAAERARTAAQNQYQNSRTSATSAVQSTFNGGGGNYNVGGTVPGTGVTYTDPDQAYKIYLASLQNGNSNNSNQQFAVNVTVPAGVQNVSQAQQVGSSFGQAVSEELRRMG